MYTLSWRNHLELSSTEDTKQELSECDIEHWALDCEDKDSGQVIYQAAVVVSNHIDSNVHKLALENTATSHMEWRENYNNYIK